MRIIETKIFTFGELSEKAQNAAIDSLRDINTGFDWYDYTFDYYTEVLESKGFSGIEINFSGFCSQGDGASFTADYIGLEKFLRSQKQWSKYKAIHGYIREQVVAAKIYRFNNFYYHESTVRCDIQAYIWDGKGKHCQLFDDLEAYITEWAREFSKDIYKALENEYNYLTGDCAIRGTILANGFEFTIDGKLI